MKRRNAFGTDLWKTVIVVSVLTLLFLAHAVYSQGEADKAKQILGKSVEAIGGEKNARGWNSRVAKGIMTAYYPGWGKLKANVSQFVKKPDKCKIDNDFSAYDHPFFYTYYYNCGQAWMVVNLMVRQSPRVTENLENFMETIDGVAYYYTECDSFFLMEEVPDDSLLAASEFERVGCIHEGDTVLFDLSRKDHTPLRMIEDGGAEITLFSDYRKVKGLTLPFHLKVYRNGALHGDHIWDEIKLDAKIDETIFEEDRPPIPDEES
ncbi:MAG: hypothetical protein JSV33_05415 [bacterium]|nr:MAG: hypothetical protein JSV33_05415 [bacterium]